jgi:hypothetical protein
MLRVELDILVFLGRMAEAMGHTLHWQSRLLVTACFEMCDTGKSDSLLRF